MKLFAVVDNKDLYVNVKHPNYGDFFYQLTDYPPRLLNRMMVSMENIVLSGVIDQIPDAKQFYMLPRLASFITLYGDKGNVVGFLETLIGYSNKNQHCDDFLSDQEPQVHSRKCVLELDVYCKATMPKAGIALSDNVLKSLMREFKGVRKTQPIKDVLVNAGYLNPDYADAYFKTVYGRNLMREIKDIKEGSSNIDRFLL